MKIERIEFLGAGPFERSEGRIWHANGFKSTSAAFARGSPGSCDSASPRLRGRVGRLLPTIARSVEGLESPRFFRTRTLLLRRVTAILNVTSEAWETERTYLTIGEDRRACMTIPGIDKPAQPPSARGWKLACFVLAVAVCFAAIVGTLGLMRARIARNETAAIATLNALATAQHRFQMAAVVDQDGDGIGEYGFLSELGGLARTRAREGGLSDAPVRSPFIGSLLTETSAAWQGIARQSGMNYLIWLPTDTGPPMREQAAVPPGVAANADVQERQFIIYAWPCSLGYSANRVFVISEQGHVYGTANRDYRNYDGLRTIPAADAALVHNPVESGTLLGGVMRSDVAATDGQVWMHVG